MEKCLSFIRDLRKNNNRDWFQANRSRYQEAKKEFFGFVEELVVELGLMDPDLGVVDAKSAIFRINRDIRFSNDKSPYKTNFGALIAKGGKKSGNAGYYFHMEPGGSFVAGGVYHPMPDVLKAIRTGIHENIDEFLDIIRDRTFQEAFGGLWEGDKLKTQPKGFPKEFEHIDLLRNRSFNVSRRMDDNVITGGNPGRETLEAFRLMVPLNRFLNLAISG